MCVEVCADAPRARVVQDFVHQPSQKLCLHARALLGGPTYARIAVVRSLPRVLVITGHMGCDFVAVLSVRRWWW